MKIVNVKIERGEDGTYGAYIEDDSLPFGIIGDGKTVAEAKADFMNSYEEMKQYFLDTNKDFVECKFNFAFDKVLSQLLQQNTESGRPRTNHRSKPGPA